MPKDVSLGRKKGLTLRELALTGLPAWVAAVYDPGPDAGNASRAGEKHALLKLHSYVESDQIKAIWRTREIQPTELR